MSDLDIGCQFIESVSKDLSIPQDKEEDWNQWANRVVYSVLGRQMLGALWVDTAEGEIGSQSIQHIRKRGTEILETVWALFPAVEFNIDVEKIMTLYRNAGHLIHCANNYEAPQSVYGEVHGMYLMRGLLAPWQSYAMSGLGGYSLSSPGGIPRDWRTMYQIPEQPIEEWWERLNKELDFSPVGAMPEQIEYCHTHNHMQWSSIRPKRQDFVFYRSVTPIPSNREYGFFQKTKDGGLEKSAMPSWMVPYDNDKEYLSAKEYYRIGYGLMTQEGVEPVAMIRRRSETVEIRLSHPLPYFEDCFFMLYTWPDLTNRYKRICSLDFSPVIKDLLTPLGYKILEKEEEC